MVQLSVRGTYIDLLIYYHLNMEYPNLDLYNNRHISIYYYELSFLSRLGVRKVFLEMENLYQSPRCEYYTISSVDKGL